MTEARYDSEDLLQTLLEQYPDLLAGDQMGAAPRRWLLISREHGVPDAVGGAARWSLDHLFVDQDAVPTLVEVKRSTDTRIRREVVGQMLDYAANAVVHWPIEVIRARFETRCGAAQIDAVAAVGDLIERPGDLDAVESFWAKMKTNILAGRLRLVFVSDEIPAELRRIIEFLNVQMSQTEVLGVEVRQFVGDGLKTLVPTVVGQTAGAQQRRATSAATSAWNEERFFQALEEKKGSEAAKAARALVAWITPRVTRLWFGRGDEMGSIVPVLKAADGTDVMFFALWTYGTVEMYFQHLRGRPVFDAEDARRELMRRLNQVPGVTLPADAIAKRPSFPIAALADESALRAFRDVIEWALEQVRSAP